LARYDFPGNVRELENLLHRALALSGAAQICVDDLELPRGQARAGEGGLVGVALASTAFQLSPPMATAASASAPPASPVDTAVPSDLVSYLDDVERAVLVRALERHRYNRTAAGSSMGLTLRQMRYRMARLGVHVASEGLLLDDADGTGLE
jgi:two-component system response regulator PilR (NtrC family)